jgi:hypothetical protein
MDNLRHRCRNLREAVPQLAAKSMPAESRGVSAHTSTADLIYPRSLKKSCELKLPHRGTLPRHRQ